MTGMDGYGLSSGLKTRMTDFLALAVFVILALAMTYPLVFHAADHVPSDLSDPLYNIWIMDWNIHQFSAGLKNFWNTNIFFPHTGTYFYADGLLALSLLGAPVSLLSGNPILAYNVLFLLSFFLCAAGMYFLVRRLSASRPAAFLSALIFAFIPYRFAHISHLELLYFVWIPFCFLFLHRFFENPSWGNLSGIGFFFVLQVYSCAYYGQYLALFAGLFILYFALKKRFFRRADFWAKMGILFFLCSAALLPYVYPFIRVHRKMLLFRPLWEVKHFSAELQHFLAVPPWNLTWGWLTGRLGAQEWQLYPGIIPVFLTLFWWIRKWKNTEAEAGSVDVKKKKKIFVLWDAANVLWLAFLLFVGISGGFKAAFRGITLSVHRLENPVLIFLVSLCLRVILDRRLRFRLRKCVQSAGLSGRFYLFAVILAWLLSLGPVIRLLGKEIIAGPYGWLYKWIPGFQGLRVPSRYVVVMMFGLSILAGSGAALFLGKWKSMKARILVAAVLGGLVVLDYASFPLPLAKVDVGAQIPAIYSRIRDLPEEPAVLELPMPRHDWDEYQEAISVYYSMRHRKKIVNGYSGYSPPGYRIVREAMEAFPSFRTFQLLQDLEVTHILVHTQGAGAERGRKIVRRLREFEDQTELIEQIQGDFLYRRLPQAKIEKTEEEILSAVRDRTRWKATSSKNPDKAGLAFDGDLNTGWTTGYPQQKGDFFRLDLGAMHRLRKLELFLNNHPLDYPRSFVVEGSADGVSWVRLAEKAHFFPAINRSMIEDFSKYVGDVSFEPCRIRCLRISLTRSHEARHWSINEIVCRE